MLAPLRNAHFPDVARDVAEAIARLTFVGGFDAVIDVNVIAGKERPGADFSTPVVFVIPIPGEPPSLDDDDVQTACRVQVLVRGTPRNLDLCERTCREAMAGLHLRRDVPATETQTGKPSVYMDLRVLDAAPVFLGENRNEADRCAFSLVCLYAD